VELTKDECQYILNAIDTHVRANGLNVAGPGLVIAQRLQAEFNGQDSGDVIPIKQPESEGVRES